MLLPDWVHEAFRDADVPVFDRSGREWVNKRNAGQITVAYLDELGALTDLDLETRHPDRPLDFEAD